MVQVRPPQLSLLIADFMMYSPLEFALRTFCMEKYGLTANDFDDQKWDYFAFGPLLKRLPVSSILAFSVKYRSISLELTRRATHRMPFGAAANAIVLGRSPLIRSRHWRRRIFVARSPPHHRCRWRSIIHPRPYHGCHYRPTAHPVHW